MKTPDSPTNPHGERMRKTICWISEAMRACPHKTRKMVLQEAEIRFDLTPRECEFLEKEFSGECGG